MICLQGFRPAVVHAAEDVLDSNGYMHLAGNTITVRVLAVWQMLALKYSRPRVGQMLARSWHPEVFRKLDDDPSQESQSTETNISAGSASRRAACRRSSRRLARSRTCKCSSDVVQVFGKIASPAKL